MPIKDIIEAIENKQSLKATELLEKTLYLKVGVLLEEKKKQVSAKTWPPESEDKKKERTKADRRKDLKFKLKK